VIRRVHALDQGPLGASGLFPEEYTAADLRQSLPERLRSLAAQLAERGKPWPLALDPDALCESAAARVPDDVGGVALHTNPGPTHTFVDPSSGRLTGLIDFGDAYIGHPAFDLWQWGDPSDRQAVLAGYLESGPLDAEFWSMWDAAQVVSDLVAISRRRPYLDRSARHLKELVAGW
jgi:Ser/Thr protein kinase RdoA (MazF antagonist)